MATHQKHSRQLQESTWTKEEALAWARKVRASGRSWPGWRFRVEGSRAGNSRLLGKKAAEQTQAKYGGVLVEVIPTPTAAGEPKRTVNQSLADELGACPSCQAPARHPCLTPKGKSRKPHGSRIKHADLYKQAQRLPPCRTCKADPGEPCTDTKGAYRPPHSRRLGAEP